jgi:GH24 family phage-related lysozyme (muramidase)
MTVIAEAILKHEEGFRPTVYPDSGGYSIGYGFYLGKSLHDIHLPREIADYILRYKTNQARAEAKFLAGDVWSKLTDTRRLVLTLMLYQLGASRARNFFKFWEALRTENYAEASTEMGDSEWALQTPERVERLMHMMKTNELHADYGALRLDI